MALTQSHYRFGSVDGTESTHGWLAGEDREVYRLPGASGQFLLRIAVQETAGSPENNVALQWQYRQNGGTWTDITTTSSVVRTGANAVFTNGAHCTKRLSGTGTFEVSGAGCTHDGSSGGAANDIAASGNSETLIGLQILNADTVVGDRIEFRVVRVGGTLLSAYDVTPALTVATELFPVTTRQPGVTGPAERAVPAGAAGKLWLVKTSIPQSVLDDPSVAFDLRMYVQNVDLSWPTPNWSVHDEFAGCTFVGGPNQGRGGVATEAPGWLTSGDEIANKNVRYYINVTGVAFDAGLIAVPQ